MHVCMYTYSMLIQTLRAFRLPSSQGKCEDISVNRISGDAVTCQGLAGLQEVPKSSRRAAFHTCFYVSERQRKPIHVCFQVSEKPRRPQDSVLCVFLRVGEAKGTDSYVFSRAGEAPEGLAGAPGGPRMAFHTCFYVSEKPRKPNLTFFTCRRGPEGLAGAWLGLARLQVVPRKPQEAPGGAGEPIYTCFYVFF